MAFMDKNFLLSTETAKRLFFEYGEKEPIFDFHCHLSPQAIYENQNFTDITEAWLGGDHYKWRAMRSYGIEEKYITGDGDSYSKFLAFVQTLQYAIGNPIYHWAHLELQRYFGIYEPLTEKNAKEIYDRVNTMLAGDDFKVQDLITKSNVKIVFTTDDPIDSLEYHKKLAELPNFSAKVLPAFRPDKAVGIDLNGFSGYISELSDVSGVLIKTFKDVLSALANRIEYFNSVGCKASDHDMCTIPYAVSSEAELETIFEKGLSGETVSPLETEKYKTAVMQFLATQYTKFGWAMEIHFGVLRNTNTRMFETIGINTGFDAAGDYNMAENLTKLLNSMDVTDNLPKTILFTINPKDNYAIGTIMGSFQGGGTASKIQFGTAWWFNDNIDGMVAQIKALANLGILGKFIGMLTDSRSFLSYPRHEYFRRILCNILGSWIENGECNPDIEFMGRIVSDISYNNAIAYFEQ